MLHYEVIAKLSSKVLACERRSEKEIRYGGEAKHQQLHVDD